MPGAVAYLAEFVRIPSISAQPKHAADVHTAAQWLAARVRRAGLTDVALVRTPRHPVVLGAWRGAPGRPTVLIYGHYDVQPAGPASAWRSPPFAPQVRGSRLYGRGASDDKGQLLCYVEAIERLMQRYGRLPVNVVCLFEGEEEVGSPNLLDVLEGHRLALAADIAIVSDTRMAAPDRPAIVYALRGSVALDVRVWGPATDLHSGTYGGAVHNPAQVLCEIVASMHDSDGWVQVPGFYDGVCPLTPGERAVLRRWGPSDATLRQDAGVRRGWGLPGATLYERTTAWPALSVQGLSGGYAGAGSSSVIPRVAVAKVGLRVVPGQDPGTIANAVGRHVARHSPPAVHTTVTLTSIADPVLLRRNGFGVQAAVAACRQVFGATPVFLRSGGTIPAISLLQQVAGLNPVLLGFGLPGDHIHAPDESLHLPTFRRGIATVVEFLRQSGRRASDDDTP